MKTSNEVEPAEMNGSSNPIGGIEPINISYCIINYRKKKEQIIALFFCLYDKVLLSLRKK